MTKKIGNENQVGDILKEIIAKNKLQPGIDRVEAAEAWKNLMGNGVSAYTRNVVLKGSTLYVELTSAVLREELSFGKSKIISMLNAELGREVVKEVVLR
jgi:hypothetical protein